MGCKCEPSSNILSETEVQFGDNNILNNEKNDKEIILKRNLTQSDFEEKDKFLDELKDNKSYNILDSIKLKEHLTYECINAYEIFMENKKNFDDIYDKEFKNSENKELNNTENIIDLNNSNEKLFKMPPIQHLDNTIYEGEFFFDKEKNEWAKGGKGTLITSNNELIIINNYNKENNYIEKGTIFYPNGDIYLGEINKDEPYNRIKGIYFENDFDNKYNDYLISNNFNQEKPNIIKYFCNGNLYEGNAEFIKDRYYFSGKGKLTDYKKNLIYEGNFKGGLFNGEGKLFKSKDNLLKSGNDENNIGTTILTNWINGKPNGEGLIREKISEFDDYNSSRCYFRFGKIIKSTKNLVKGKKFLDENIFNFLSLSDISKLYGSLKTKSFYNFLKENDNMNLIKLKLYNAIYKHEIGIYNPEIINNELFNIKKKNTDDIYSSLLDDKSYFLPFVCYYSNGGEIEKRYRPYNIFNPDQKKMYSTNYLNNKSTNIILRGIFNKNLYEEFKEKEEFFYDKYFYYIDNFKQMASLYGRFYDKFERNYPVRKVDTDILDYSVYIINNDKLGNFEKIFCTYQYIMFSIPEKIDELSVLINPCYFFAVYIGIYNNNNDIMNNNYIDITDEEIKENNYEMNLISEKYEKYIIKKEKEKNLFEYIEFDTMKQKEFDMKILCLVKIYEKNDINNPYIIKLKKFFHYGNLVNVKLINQCNIYTNNTEGFAIDFGSIHFYGDVIYLKE